MTDRAGNLRIEAEKQLEIEKGNRQNSFMVKEACLRIMESGYGKKNMIVMLMGKGEKAVAYCSNKAMPRH